MTHSRQLSITLLSSSHVRMESVDLKLAITYLPVLLCFVKIWVMQAVLSLMVTVNDFTFCYTFLFLTLLGDRITNEDFIFDSNGTVFLVLGASIVGAIRNILHLEQAIDGRLYTGLFYAHGSMFVGMVWCTCALAIHFAPLRSSQKLSFQPFLALAVTYLGICLCSILPQRREDTLPCTIRSSVFALLCVLWVYLLGVTLLPSSAPPRRAGPHYMCRFAPVLFVPMWCAAAFSAAALVGLLFQCGRVHGFTLAGPLSAWPCAGPAHAPQGYQGLHPTDDAFRPAQRLEPTLEEPDMEVAMAVAPPRDADDPDEALFWLAKSALETHRR